MSDRMWTPLAVLSCALLVASVVDGFFSLHGPPQDPPSCQRSGEASGVADGAPHPLARCVMASLPALAAARIAAHYAAGRR
jgi:hypothetical protein